MSALPAGKLRIKRAEEGSALIFAQGAAHFPLRAPFPGLGAALAGQLPREQGAPGNETVKY
ncbi:MAG: hypothetical protein L0Y57_10175 [Beijerinckiaceae bacterium]|nr:hypothetical protein [Beijerinckiaceae bacterium]